MHIHISSPICVSHDFCLVLYPKHIYLQHERQTWNTKIRSYIGLGMHTLILMYNTYSQLMHRKTTLCYCLKTWKLEKWMQTGCVIHWSNISNMTRCKALLFSLQWHYGWMKMVSQMVSILSLYSCMSHFVKVVCIKGSRRDGGWLAKKFVWIA